MRPADDPEFFRRPPPPGRSRESTLRLDRLGRFWHDGRPVEHPGMARSFAAWVDRHPDDGRFILNNGYDWSYLEVEDAPCHVRALRSPALQSSLAALPSAAAEPPGSTLPPAGVPVLALTDGSHEPLDPRHVWLGTDGALRCLVRGGRWVARFSQAAQLALAPYLGETPEGGVALSFGGALYPIASEPPAGSRSGGSHG